MSTTHNKVTVLYVDDEQGNLSGFRSNFRREFNVLTAQSGEEALKLIAEHEVHVVISDQRMPGMEGADLLARVRELNPRAVRMLMTAYADVQAVIDAVNKGNIFGYATKPYDPADLRIRIEQAASLAIARSEADRTNARYKQVFEAAGDPIFLVDGKACIVQANGATERLLGATQGSLIGKNFLELLEHRRDLVTILREHRKGGDMINLDISLRGAAGRVVDCLLTANCIGQDLGGALLYQAVLKDITDRKQEELRLQKLNADLDKRVVMRTRQLREAIDDLASFSYSVAHDLRSPLKNMLALAGMLNESAPPEEALAPRIASNAGRMLDLVDDLLRFALTNRTSLLRSEINLLDVVKEVVSQTVRPEKQAAVELEIDQDLLVNADSAMLKVLFTNLIGNALKFTRDKTDATVTVACARELNAHHITVSDNGIGFDTTAGVDVFAAFKRMHRTDQFEGSGIGLSIVQRIVAKHGGEVWAVSAPGEGCTIHVRLPITPAEDNALPFEERA